MGDSHSFISEQFVLMHALSTKPLPAIVTVTSPLGGGIVSVKLVRNYELHSEGNLIELDCIVLGLSDFDCIVGIDTLTKYRATADCFQKVFRFRPEMAEEWKFFGKGSRSRIPLIFVLSMTHFFLQKGAEGFLIYAVDVLKSSPELVDIPVVRELANFFPNKIPGLPPIREVEFGI
ncbi:uncharacterized protein [Henckelia pumila]|uniref:uncharacterized protein n=1 Tax=Henckelia pumila TaxID=405737 RepID=UPI003C6DF621